MSMDNIVKFCSSAWKRFEKCAANLLWSPNASLFLATTKLKFQKIEMQIMIFARQLLFTSFFLSRKASSSVTNFSFRFAPFRRNPWKDIIFCFFFLFKTIGNFLSSMVECWLQLCTKFQYFSSIDLCNILKIMEKFTLFKGRFTIITARFKLAKLKDLYLWRYL